MGHSPQCRKESDKTGCLQMSSFFIAFMKFLLFFTKGSPPIFHCSVKLQTDKTENYQPTKVVNIVNVTVVLKAIFAFELERIFPGQGRGRGSRYSYLF